MRRKLWVIGAIVVGMLLASTFAYADRILAPNAPKARLGQVYDRTNILRIDEGPVGLPRPVGNPNSSVGVSAAAAASEIPMAGPVAASLNSPKIGGIGMAQPRGGGSMYSSQQQADREIKNLIRRLN